MGLFRADEIVLTLGNEVSQWQEEVSIGPGHRSSKKQDIWEWRDKSPKTMLFFLMICDWIFFKFFWFCWGRFFCCFVVFFKKQKSQLPVAGWAGVIWCAVSVTGHFEAGCRCQMEWAKFSSGFDAGCSLGNCWSRAKARLGINGCNSKDVNEVWPCLRHVYICPWTSFLHSWAIDTFQPIRFSTFFFLLREEANRLGTIISSWCLFLTEERRSQKRHKTSKADAWMP